MITPFTQTIAMPRNSHNIKYRQRRKAQKKVTGTVTFGDNVDIPKPSRESSRIGPEEIPKVKYKDGHFSIVCNNKT